MDDYPYMIFCGGLDTMQRIAQRGVRALNPTTMRWKAVSKTARYEAVETERFVADGVEHILGDLRCNEDLRQIAKERGLILS